jgi:tRNA(Ile)-lysidine synthase
MKEFYGWILRPLLDIEKKEILEYLDKNKLKYFIDSSNLENKYSRNYLRNEIIPRFSKINSKFKKNISKTISYFEDLKNYIDEEVKGFLWENNNFVILEFNKKSIFLQKEIIRYIYYISNNKSTIWLSESNINEIIRFINWKNNKTIKEIKNMKLKKDNKIIKF